ncbi:MAG: hypothetical protein ISS45_03965, partial [Candidatus Omnitrophica bacterium]|nr:hypothetical protein [Candidatus Omnitrophota bacterium]
SFAAEEAQPAIDQTILGKSGAYELKFTQAGLTGIINGTQVSSIQYPVSQFFHTALTYDGANVKLYVDGIEKDSQGLTGAINTNSNNLLIGDGLKGAIDEIRVWNVARAVNKINTYKQRYLSADEAGLVCFLRCNENTGTTASDATANANNGTLSADATWLDRSFAYTLEMPVALYHMDEGSGASSADASGNNNTLSLDGASWSNNDLTGFSTANDNALSFNGANSYGSIVDSDSLDIEGKISIEVWMKPDTAIGNHTILVKGDDSGANEWNYKLEQVSNNLVFSFYNGALKSHATITNFIIADETYYIVLTFDESADRVKIYVNADEVYSGSESSTMITNSHPVYVGKGATYKFSGVMDEIRIHERILSADEINRRYEHGRYTENEPTIYNVYEPAAIAGVFAYATNHPVIQPVLGAFYTGESICEFSEIANKPFDTEIKYQISPNGYRWYWYDGASWELIDAGYSEANTASDVNSNLSTFQGTFTEGDFYYRAYLHSGLGSFRRPSLDNIAISLVTGETFYIDPTGATDINSLHSDANNDRWFQYKAMLYSEGEDTPILANASLEYIDVFITVNTPNGGQDLAVGASYDITWDSQAITKTTGLVKLEYSPDSGSTYTIIEENVANSGTYSWTIPDDPSQNALVKISSEDFPAVSDESDASFRILSLRVTSPNGGEVWEQGKTHNITWTSMGTIPNNVVKIEYSSDAGSNWETVSDITPNTGTYQWTVPQAASDSVLVKISGISGSDIMDTSDDNFAIVPVPEITVTSPASGASWMFGTEETIQWQTNQNQFTGNFILEYSTDGFVNDINTIQTVTAAVPDNPNDDISGSYDWAIPDAVSSTAQVRVKEETIPPARDTQQVVSGLSAAFSIIEPAITLTSPTTGDIWVVGDTRTITWGSQGTVSNNLLLEYSVDGQNYTVIATGEGNDGQYSWVNIPSEAAGDSVYVRITDNTRTQVYDASEAFQVLAYCIITVIQPNGSESLTMGTDYNIQWSSYGQKIEPGGDDYYNINIYYSADNGETWTIIAYNTANTGSYPWQVADAVSEQCLIKVNDSNDSLIEDISDAVFSIVLPTITFDSPNGGEVWFATGDYEVTWESEGTISDNLTLEYSADAGASWNTIAIGEYNDNTYTWSPIADVDSQQVLLRITDASRPTVFDTSNSNFTITPPTVTILSPNGGEEMAAGTSYEITWWSQGYEFGAISDSLTIKYSVDGGNTYPYTITAAAQTLEDFFSWVGIPGTLSTDCFVKIYDANREATVDTSDGAFSIVRPYVNITSPELGSQWPMGTGQTITWTYVGSVSNSFTLQYSIDGGVTWPYDIDPVANAAYLIATGVSRGTNGQGSYNWTVPNQYYTTVKVKMTDDSDPLIEDISELFAISSPVLTVTAPNGSELWTVGDIENITWQNVGSVELNKITIQYSTDNFDPGHPENTHNITTGGTNCSCGGEGNCSYSWTVEDDVSATVRVKIFEVEPTHPGSVASDKSNANFTILPVPVITITSPAEADLWRVGTEQEIIWEDNGGLISNDLTLKYSTDAGASWTEIATGEANDGSYTWAIPNDTGNNCKIGIVCSLRPETQFSSAVFEIGPPLITITSPNGDEVWAVADSAPITWTTEGTISENLLLYYSTDNGSTYTLIDTGVANSGSYTWSVADELASYAKFKILDGENPNVYDETDGTFAIIQLPRFVDIVPEGGEEYVLGDTVNIAWSSEGLDISQYNLFISLLNTVTLDTQIIAQSVENTGAYTWFISESALTGASMKLVITDGERTEVTGLTAGTFKIRGGFEVLTPDGGENWLAESAHTVSWQTKGSIPKIKLEYSSDGGSIWHVITASADNSDSYNWTLPDIQSSSVKVKVSDATDPSGSVYSESDDVFNIIYATVQFKVLDYDTLQHLQDIAINEPATGWSVTGQNSPITRTESYPYGTYTTFITKTNFIDNSVTWSPPIQGTATYVITCYLENQASAQVTWEAILTYSFSPAGDTFSAVGSLQRKGKLVGTREMERLDMGSSIVTIYEPDGTTVKHTLIAAAPNENGMYNFALSETGFEAGKVYPATLSIMYRERDYISAASIDVGSEILQYEFFTQTAAQLTESVSTIEQAVAGGTAEIQDSLSEETAEIKTSVASGTTDVKSALTTAQTAIRGDTADILTATQTTLPSQVSEVKDAVTTSMRSRILNVENAVKTGNLLTIKYRTYTGLSPVIDVYDGGNLQRIVKGAMTEIGTTGIYEYPVRFLSGWGRGDFTIVCSESAKGTLDALTISILRSDIEQIAGDVSAIMGATSGITGLSTVADSLNTQLTVVESALTGIDDLTGSLIDTTSEVITENMKTVHSRLTDIGQRVKTLGGEHGINLETLYNVSQEGTTNITYLKNKTQEMKAAIEITRRIVESADKKPVFQEWYEFKQ